MRIRGNSGKNSKICLNRENLKIIRCDLKLMDIIKIIIFGQKLEQRMLTMEVLLTIEAPSGLSGRNFS